MAVTITPRINIGLSGVIDQGGFMGFGSGGFDGENDLFFEGDEADDIITGGTGMDLLEGRGGNDVLRGGDGNDTLGGGPGDDDLDGQGGGGEKEKDKLFGDAGNDILRAGHGFDELTGGSGNDTFEFYALGHFEVTDFTIGEDRLFFDSEKTGINDLGQLVQLITGVDQRDDGVTIEFANNAVSIDLVGVNLSELTPDMIVFTL